MKNVDLNIDKRKILSEFILTQIFRTPNSIKKLKSIHDKFVEQLCHKVGYEQSEKYLNHHFSNYNVEDQFLYNLFSDVKNLVLDLIRRPWIYWFNTTDFDLLTSDHPAFGFFIEDTEIFEIILPISNKVLLSLILDTKFKVIKEIDNNVIPIDKENVEFYNSNIILNSLRFILGNENNFEFINKVLDQ